MFEIKGETMDTDMMRNCERVFSKVITANKTNEAILFVESTNGDFSYSQGYGGKDIDSPILMATLQHCLQPLCILAISPSKSKLISA